MIYFDNGATTFPKPLSVRKAINEAMSDYGANPGRSGHKMSVKSSEIMYSCRDNAAKLFGSENPENIIFTLNCTTALNTVIKGILKQGDHAIISSLEHNAVVRPLETLKKNKIEYSVAECVPYDDEQTIENFRKQCKSNTKLVMCTCFKCIRHQTSDRKNRRSLQIKRHSFLCRCRTKCRNSRYQPF